MGGDMGEAKRRQETDANYGKKAKAQTKPSQRSVGRFSLKKVSKTEWIIWAVLFGVSFVAFIATRQV
ncbi:MAG: hypothetical protein HC812_18240 [Leptolyngbya sp. RL_3_1]|nr:hypothetical protein [Leptolyngbya sp. RL_3_1]